MVLGFLTVLAELVETYTEEVEVLVALVRFLFFRNNDIVFSFYIPVKAFPMKVYFLRRFDQEDLKKEAIRQYRRIQGIKRRINMAEYTDEEFKAQVDLALTRHLINHILHRLGRM